MNHQDFDDRLMASPLVRKRRLQSKPGSSDVDLDSGFRSSQRDAEALLRRIEAADRAEHRGQLKIFLGYASGVGKSFRLFDEGRRRRARGEDVVVAAVQKTSSPEVDQLLRGLETIPTLEVGGAPVIDVPAVLLRR